MDTKEHDKRMKQLEESARKHKAKFWTKIEGKSLDDITIMQGASDKPDEDALPKGPIDQGSKINKD